MVSSKGIDIEAMRKGTAAGTLNELNLKGKGLGDEDIIKLVELIKESSGLVALKLRDNDISDAGVAVLVEALREDSFIEYLNIRGNKITSLSGVKLGELLAVNSTLKYVDIAENKLGDVGIEYLCAGLKENIGLVELDVRECGIGDAGAISIGKVLKVHTSLAELKLWKNEIGDEGIKGLAEGLEDNYALTTLDISENKIGDRGWKYLAEALAKNSKLSWLNLNRSDLGDEELIKIIEALEVSKSISRLYLGKNKLSDISAGRIAAMLKVMALHTIDLKDNQLSGMGAKKILDALKGGAELMHLDLMGNKGVPVSVLGEIDELLAYNKKLFKEKEESYAQYIEELKREFKFVCDWASGTIENKEAESKVDKQVGKMLLAAKEVKREEGLSRQQRFLLMLLLDSKWDFKLIKSESKLLNYGYTALHLAALVENIELIKQLIRQGFLLSTRSISGKTAADFMVEGGYFAELSIKLLREGLLSVEDQGYVVSKAKELNNPLLYKRLKKEKEFIDLELQLKLSAAQSKSRDLQEIELKEQIKAMTVVDVIGNARERLLASLKLEKRLDNEEELYNLMDHLKLAPQMLDHVGQEWSKEKGKLQFKSPLFKPLIDLIKELDDNAAAIRKYLKANKGVKSFSGAQACKDICEELENIKKYYVDYIKEVCAAKEESKRESLYKVPGRLQSAEFCGLLIPKAEKVLCNLDGGLEHGTHKVKILNGVHYKLWPHAPGVEFMVDSLNKIIAGLVSAPTELLKVIDGKENHYPYMASRTVIGSELQFILEQRPEAIGMVDRYNFSAMMVLGMLTNPQDGKPDNYMVDVEFGADKEIKSYKILGIDNDMAFVPALVKGRFGDDVTVKNVLYFFPQMEEVVDKRFREDFVRREPELIMIEWLAALAERNNSYEKLVVRGVFSREEMSGFKEYDTLLASGSREGREKVEAEFNGRYGKVLGEIAEEEKMGKSGGFENAEEIIKNGLQLPMRFSAGSVRGVYQKLVRIKELLIKNEEITHIELLKGVERVVGLYYAAIKKEIIAAGAENVVMSCIWKIYGKKEYAGVVPNLKRLLERAQQRGDTANLTRIASTLLTEYGLETGREKSIGEAAEEFVASIDFSKLDAKSEELILLQIGGELSFIEHLRINGSRIKDDRLLKFIGNFSNLKSLELVNLSRITVDGPEVLLRKWKLDGKGPELIIENCANLGAKELEQLLGVGYMQVSIKVKGLKLAISGDKVKEILLPAVEKGIFDKELYDYCHGGGKIDFANILYNEICNKRFRREVYDYCVEQGVKLRGEFLQTAIGLGQVKIVEYLISKGCDRKVDYPLMHSAVKAQSTAIIELLIAAGEDVNAAYKGKTALGYAVEKGYAEVVSCLNSHGGKLLAEEEERLGAKLNEILAVVSKKVIVEVASTKQKEESLMLESKEEEIGVEEGAEREIIIASSKLISESSFLETKENVIGSSWVARERERREKEEKELGR